MSQLNSLLVALGLALALPALADGMNEMPHMQGSAMGNGAEMAAKMARGIGTVKSVDTKKGTVTLDHQAINELSWPAMTMSFKVAKAELLNGITVGQRVNFTLQWNDMSPVVTAISVSK